MILTITLNPAIDRMYYVDSIMHHDVIRPNEYYIGPGGKGLNVSKVLNILKQDVCAMGFLGGHHGNYIHDELKRLTIETFFTKIQMETRVCFTIRDKHKRVIELVEGGPVITASEQNQLLDDFNKKIKKATDLVLSGSLPKGVSNEFYPTLMRIAKEHNVKVFLDTSQQALKKALTYHPFLVKPNKHEAEAFMGQPLHTENAIIDAAKTMVRRGAEHVAISLGENGMIFAMKDRVYRVTIPKVDTWSTTGSGDSTLAGFVYGFTQDMTIEDILRFANACGMSNATMKSIGIIDQNQVNKYLQAITVEKVS